MNGQPLGINCSKIFKNSFVKTLAVKHFIDHFNFHMFCVYWPFFDLSGDWRSGWATARPSWYLGTHMFCVCSDLSLVCQVTGGLAGLPHGPTGSDAQRTGCDQWTGQCRAYKEGKRIRSKEWREVIITRYGTGKVTENRTTKITKEKRKEVKN